MEPYGYELAVARGAELRAEATRHALAALAACCRPAGWRRVLRDVRRRTAAARCA